ncbi:MAG: DUF222 domain-containing protein [Pseudonocardiaceae bacterium]
MRKPPASPSPKPAPTDHHPADHTVTPQTNGPASHEQAGPFHTPVIGRTDDGILGKINAGQQATAAVFATGETSLRHVEVITDALGSPAAARLTPDVWAGAEEQLAQWARLYRPRELAGLARDLIDTLDQDGAEPDDRDQVQLNELHLSRNAAGSGGRIKGTLDPATFDALATAVDALSPRTTAEDHRTLGERQADALGEICRTTLDCGELPEVGGQRPHLTVTIPLAELEGRARGAALDFGGPLSPAGLRMLACDAAVIPVVLGGQGQPLDLGRAVRTVTPAMRRAVAARDRGCAFPGVRHEALATDVEVRFLRRCHVAPWR